MLPASAVLTGCHSETSMVASQRSSAGPVADADDQAGTPSGAPFRLLLPETHRVRVLETVPAGGYLYVRVRLQSGEERIVASMKKKISRTDDVSVTLLGRERDFRSRAFDKTFPDLWFGIFKGSV